MKIALILSGVLATVAILAPMLVVVGYFFLIVPGLVLTAAPTVFVYLAVTSIVRRLLPIASPTAATAAAFGIALLLGLAVMQPFRERGVAAHQSELLPDVAPKRRIALDGNVRLELNHRRQSPECDYLCMAILDSPDVDSVSIETAKQNKKSGQNEVAAYALTPANKHPTPGLFPTKPGLLLREHPGFNKSFRGKQYLQAAKAVEAGWALRLAGDERLIEKQPVAADDADWVIRIEDGTNYRKSTFRRIEVLDSSGTVRFRKSYVKHSVPANMFYFGFDVHCGAGTISGASFHIGRESLQSGDRSLRVEPDLLTAIECVRPPCDEAVIARLYDEVERALDNPTSPAAKLALARQYLGLFFFDAKPQDYPLIAKVVADERVQDIGEPLANVYSRRAVPAEFHVAFAERILMDHTSAKLRHSLAEELANMPPGTFVEPAEVHLAVWNTPEIWQQAAPFLACMADLGPERVTPALMEKLEASLELSHWFERRQIVDGVREGFIRLGPGGAAAAPRIRELFLRRPSPIMNNAGEADAWRFALARMGVALSDLPYFPNQSPSSIERSSRNIANKLERYEQQRAEDQDP